MNKYDTFKRIYEDSNHDDYKYVETTWKDLKDTINNADSNLRIKITDPENVVLGDSGTFGTIGNIIYRYKGKYLFDFTPSDLSTAKYTPIYSNIVESYNIALFSYCTNLSGIGKLPTSITNTNKLFKKCINLTKVDTSSFKNTTFAGCMFQNCTSLISIDTSTFTNVKDAPCMFDGCTSLTNIDTSAFTNVTDADYMFYGCTSLTNIDTSAFKNIESGKHMFDSCTNLNIDVRNDYLFNHLSNSHFGDDEYDESTKNKMFKRIYEDSNHDDYNYVETTWEDLEDTLDNMYSNLKIKITDPENVVLGDADAPGTLGYIISSYTGSYFLDFTPSDFSTATYTADSKCLFFGCTNLSGMCKLPNNIIDASSMFQNCTGLTSIDTSGFTNVIDAFRMFANCTGLTSIDTSAFTKVTHSTGMFSGCTGLTSINTSVFTNVTNASDMFSNCQKLTSIDTSAFKNVTNAEYMFYNCTSLTNIDTSAFKNVKNANSMFSGCTNLNIDVRNDYLFNHLSNSHFGDDEYDESTKNKMFKRIYEDSNHDDYKYVETTWEDLEDTINNADSNLRIKITDPENVVLGDSYTSGTIGNIIYSYIGKYMFDFTPSEFSTAKYTVASTNLFDGCINLSGMCKLPSSITNAQWMFNECIKLTIIDTSGFTKVTDADKMFYNCTELTSIDTTVFKKVTDAENMFSNCTGLTSIDTTAFKNVKYPRAMFYNCTGLTNIDTTAFTKVTDAENMFSNCTGLTSIDTTAFKNVKYPRAMFYNCTGLTSIDLSVFHNNYNVYYLGLDNIKINNKDNNYYDEYCRSTDEDGMCEPSDDPNSSKYIGDPMDAYEDFSYQDDHDRDPNDLY